MDIREKTIDRVLVMLNATGAKYEIHFNGKVYGALPKPEPVALARKKRNIPEGHRMGEIKEYLDPLIGDMAVGEVVKITNPPYDLERVRSSICARMCSKFGNGSFTSSISRRDNTVEVLRMA